MSSFSNKRLIDFVSPRTLQRLQDNFANAMGISAAIYDLQGNPITKARVNNEMLSSICGASKREAMKAVDRRKVYIYECQSGVYSFAAPIMVEGNPVAFFKGGQVRLGNPDIKMCKERSEDLDLPFDEYLEAYLGLPLFTRERLEAAAELLKMVVSTISTMAYGGASTEEELQQVTYINDLLEAEVKRQTMNLEQVKERYRLLFENAEDVIYTVSAEGILTSINSAIVKVTGYEPSEVIDRHFSEFVAPSDLDRVKASFAAILAGEKMGTSGLQFELLHKKGGTRCVELNSRGIRDFDGNLLEIEGVLRDVTGTLDSQRAIEASERKYRLLFENSSKPIFLLNRKGVCVNVNKALVSFLGYEARDSFEGKEVKSFIPSELHEEYERVAKRYFASNDFEDNPALLVLLTRAGEKKIVDVSLSMISEDLYMGIVWPRKQEPSRLARRIRTHPHFEKFKLFNILKN